MPGRPTVLVRHSFYGSASERLIYVAAPDAGEDYTALAKTYPTPPPTFGRFSTATGCGNPPLNANKPQSLIYLAQGKVRLAEEGSAWRKAAVRAGDGRAKIKSPARSRSARRA
jgi:hypothetical protein